MRTNLRTNYRLVLLTVMLATLRADSVKPAHAHTRDAIKTTVGESMVIMNLQQSNTEIVLAAWNKTEQIHSTLVADTLVTGKCIHCNKNMSFTADRASASCKVCPCSATYAECLTGRGTKNTTCREMLDDLPAGAVLRIEFINPNRPGAGVKLLAVDSRSALLPLSRPLEISDADLITAIKPMGVRMVERAEGNELIRLSLKDDWSTEKARRVIKVLAEHGIVVNFTVAGQAKE